MRFNVLAIDARQQVVALSLEAASEALAADQARSKGLSVISLSPVGFRLAFPRPKKRFPVMLFSIELLSLLEAGLNLVEALQTLSEKEGSGERQEVLSAILAAIQTTRFTSADILRGTGYELDAITTAVIGGSLLTGGYGSVAGTALGALALGMARQGIVFADINADWYKIAIGTLLLVAVVLNNWIRRKFAGLT